MWLKQHFSFTVRCLVLFPSCTQTSGGRWCWWWWSSRRRHRPHGEQISSRLFHSDEFVEIKMIKYSWWYFTSISAQSETIQHVFIVEKIIYSVFVEYNNRRSDKNKFYSSASFQPHLNKITKIKHYSNKNCACVLGKYELHPVYFNTNTVNIIIALKQSNKIWGWQKVKKCLTCCRNDRTINQTCTIKSNQINKSQVTRVRQRI